MPSTKAKFEDKQIPENLHIRNAFEQLLSKECGEPIDFELPRHLREHKSHYVPIKRNIYLTKRRVEDDGIFCSCKSSGKSGVCGGDCHCGMLFSTCSSNCNCGSECRNKPFQHQPVKKMKLVKTKNCGWGVIADEDIKKGDFVIEYVGEVIDDKTCEERLWKMKHRGDTNFYLCEVNHDMVIDATYKGNKSRFINHSCEPNTEMQKWSIEGETRIGIFATCHIKKGDSLTYDYQFVQFGADQDCFCGAVGCRQKLGSKFSKLKESLSNPICLDLPNGIPTGLLRKADSCNCIDVMVRIWHPTYNRYYGGVILDFDSCTCKHTIQYEDGSIEKVDMSKQEWAFL